MNEAKSHVNINISGATAADAVAQLKGFLALAGVDPLSGVETEALLSELRDRMAKNGQVVRIVPFDGEKSSETATNDPAPRKPRRTAADKAAEQPKPETPAPASTAEQRQPEEQAKNDAAKAAVGALADTAGAALPSDAAEQPAKTIEDVKAALNAFATVNGQVKARELMQQHGGAMRLMDIPADKYGALVAALAVLAQQAA